MTTYSSDLLRLLDGRGYLHQLTDAAGLDALAAKQIVPGYVGFDATAPSFHVGNLVSIMLLRRLQQAGHKPIVIIGGGTTKVGDPSGKDEIRKLLDDDGIAANIASLRTTFERFLTFGDGPTDAVIVNNDEWLGQLGYIDFLRDIGRHFTINRMLTFDSVKLRLDREQPLTFLEFNYMILQAYDFLELSRRYGCRLQMGGSDQWGNIVNGIELGRRIDGAELFGATTPLITRADGSKMGKSVSGAIWLNEEQLSSYDYWQFWRNTARLETLEGAEINEAKKVLADAATAICRGADAAAQAAETARRTFEEGTAGEALPSHAVPGGEIAIVDALVALGLAASKGEARRLIKGGGARVDGEKVADENYLVRIDAETVRISAGKKHHGLLSR
jgi:tyrosyl-tRNA synthetase